LASVRLSYEETRANALPPVCACCGGPAAAYRARHFSWAPGTAGLFLLVGHVGHLLHFAFTRRATVWLPLCQRHLERARREISLSPATVIMLAVLGLALFFGITAAGPLLQPGGVGDRVAFCLLVGILAGAGVIAVAAAVVGIRGHLRPSGGPVLRVTEITDPGEVCLSGVAEEFAEALEWERRAQNRPGVGP
jgi:hypothetical protein